MPKRKPRQPKVVDAIENSSDDEEIDEDEAFNSEDEKKYGAFFNKKQSSSSSSDEEEASSDDNSDNDDDNLSVNEESEDEEAAGQAMMELLDSAFGRSVKKATTPEAKIKQKATLDQLLEGLEDARGFGDLQTAYKHGMTQATAPPVPYADKLQRKVHYERQSDAVSEFQSAVNANRVAETLDFRPAGNRTLITRDDRVDQFEPTTDFELKIHDALSKLQEADGEKEDDLGDANVDFATLQERHKQLSKMRSLMFSYEQKRHHMKKIKSKTYRRIRKKQRERQKDSEIENDSDEEKRLREQQEIDRMKERASLTHKNTSKWAKRILKKKHGVDINTRRALSAQLQRSADLRAKLTNDSGDESGNEEDLAAIAKGILNGGEDNNGEEKGIFSMKFMKEGAERQREQAKKEARELLAELEASNEEADDEAETQASSEAKKVVPKATKAEMNTLLKEGEMMVTARKYGPGAVVATGAMVLPEMNVNDSTSRQRVEHTTTLDSEIIIGLTEKETKSKSRQNASKEIKAVKPEGTENPWLAAVGEKIGTKSVPSKTKSSKSSKGSYVDVDRAVDLLQSTPDLTKTMTSNPEESILESKETKAITLLTQEELVEKAFATLNDEEIEKDFALEKQAVQEKELAPKKKKKDMTTSSGWGSWTGEGAIPSKRRFKFRKGFEPPPSQKEKRKRKDQIKPHVILSQKRVKKTADKYMLSEVPYPFTSREEYERSLAGGIGPEWNVTSSFKAMTRPEIYTRAGKIIQPISKKMKVKRAPAKF